MNLDFKDLMLKKMYIYSITDKSYMELYRKLNK